MNMGKGARSRLENMGVTRLTTNPNSVSSSLMVLGGV
jgi:hypothetical protein